MPSFHSNRAARRCKDMAGGRHIRTAPGQAVVELALSITFIALLLAAAVDLGLAYKTHQTLINATSEAASYLDQYPAVDCVNVGRTGTDPIVCADAEARDRFREEQGDAVRAVASTQDLNANGISDTTNSDYDITQAVRIDAADNTQINTTYNNLDGGYDPNATFSECKERASRPNDTSGLVSACYIVIRSQISYKPLVLGWLLGREMTIRTTVIRKIVTGK